ncbi:MAG: methionyl-tRNA formyltransferase, partial [Nitrosomonadaceae bacterium]|nr:methionyl-tRNA formyltransferase [Nitrosomonadaceae bacterium]
ITIMQMDAGLDTGDILLTHNVEITPNDTTQSLHDKLSVCGARSIVEALTLLSQEKLVPVLQDETQACYAAKITKAEAEIDWRHSAQQIDRMVRTFNPNPGAYVHFRDMALKIWQAEALDGNAGKLGEIVAVDRAGITVACGSGLLRIAVVQKPGGKKMSAADFLAGNPIEPGECFMTVHHPATSHD